MSLIQSKSYISGFWCILVPFCDYQLVKHSMSILVLISPNSDQEYNSNDLLLFEIAPPVVS